MRPNGLAGDEMLGVPKIKRITGERQYSESAKHPQTIAYKGENVHGREYNADLLWPLESA